MHVDAREESYLVVGSQQHCHCVALQGAGLQMDPLWDSKGSFYLINSVTTMLVFTLKSVDLSFGVISPLAARSRTGSSVNPSMPESSWFDPRQRKKDETSLCGLPEVWTQLLKQDSRLCWKQSVQHWSPNRIIHVFRIHLCICHKLAKVMTLRCFLSSSPPGRRRVTVCIPRMSASGRWHTSLPERPTWRLFQPL